MAATADYLADHPFAPPDIVNPPEAPTYKYRPDINSLVDLAGIETVALSAGSRVDILIDNLLQTYVLQAGAPTGSDLEVVPDDYDALLNQQYWLLVAASTLAFIGIGSLSFDDISGTVSIDQLPPGSVVTVDSIGEDALYFFDDSTSLPSLIGADDVANFLNGHINFTNVAGTISVDQLPPGSVTTIDSIDEDGFYFFDNDTFLPELLGKNDSLIFLLPDQTGQDGLFLQTNAGVLSWAAASGGGGSIASTSTVLQGDGAGAAVASHLTEVNPNVLVFSHSADNANDFTVQNTNSGVNAYAYVAANSDTVSIDIEALSSTCTVYDPSIALPGDVGLFGTARMYIATTGAILFSNDGLTTERARINNGLSVGSTTDPGSGNILLAGLTASVFVKTDASKILVSKTASEMRTDLALVIGTNVQAWDADLDTWATKTPYAGTLTITTAKTFNVTNTLTLSGTDSSTLNVGAGGTLGSAAYTASSAYDAAGAAAAAQSASQPLDSDLTTIAGLTATTDNFIVSVASAWASRTPTQVKTTLGLTIGTNVQAWDADLDTLAGLTATTNNFIVSVSSVWASRTPTQVKSTLAIANTDVSGLGTLSTQSGTFSGTSSGTNTGDQTVPVNTTATSHQFFTAYDSSTGAFTKAVLVAGDIPDISATYQPLDGDLTTIAGLTATTDNFIVSVSSAWASRTPTQVKTTLGLVIGTNVQAWDADLDTLASLTATTDNFIVSVSSAWASRTPTQVRTTLGLVIGTNVQAWDTDLDSWAAVARASGFDTFTATPSSANLRSLMSDEIGTGACVFDGATLTLLLTTATCGSSLASLNIPAGTVPTTPNDGDIFADANCLYGCTDAGNPGVIPIKHIIRADGTVTYANDTNSHAIFTTPTNGRLTLETGTYRFEGLLGFTSMSATSGNLLVDMLGAGGATIGSWLWRSIGQDNVAGTAATISGAWIVTNTSPVTIVAAGTATGVGVYITGSFEVTGAGTIIPSMTQANAAAAVLSIGSYIMFERIGSTSMTSVGQWD